MRLAAPSLPVMKMLRHTGLDHNLTSSCCAPLSLLPTDTSAAAG